jgi:hypothetical protein
MVFVTPWEKGIKGEDRKVFALSLFWTEYYG